MGASECEGCCGVVKSGRQPGNCRVALGAVVIKIAADMIRVFHSGECALVARVTVLGRSLVGQTMAAVAVDTVVTAGQGESGGMDI